MARLWALENPVKRYAWGSATAIPAIVGDANPGAEPWAELWMGAHPGAPSAAVTDAGAVALPALFADDRSVLGPAASARAGGDLPFMMKLLAAAEPLSIQCHPDRAQARAGFEREEAAGVPRDAPERSYRDRNHKPELLVAESPFVALAGFRAPLDIAAKLGELGVAELEPEAQRLQRTGDLRTFFAALMRLEADRAQRVLAQAAAGARAADTAEAARVSELLARHPRDIGALAPIYLNLLELEPGQALFMPARQLHAYLEGVGIEVMASSDNVLRGGLTTKHVDVAELLEILDFESEEPSALHPEPQGDALVYPAPAPEFQLARVDVDTGAARELELGGSVAIGFCIDGAVELADLGGERLALPRGRAALVSAAAQRVRVAGRGRLYVARVPG